MRHLRLSPRNLGVLKTGNYCPGCFWYKLQVDFKLPFNHPMPGIMFNLDRFEKRLVDAHHADKGVLPEWLKELGAEAPVAFPPKLTWDSPNHDITLVGMPDAVLSDSDGNLIVVDYKTAKLKGGDDPFMPIYETQLLGYAHLLEQSGIGKVGSAALVYFENQVHEHLDSPLDLLTKEGFSVPMGVAIKKVDIDLDELPPLLDLVRKIADTRTPPEGLEKCKDCARLEALFNLDEQITRNVNSRASRDSYVRQVLRPRLEQEKRRALRAADDIELQDEHLFPELLPSSGSDQLEL